MNKISTFKEFQKLQTFWQRTSFFKSSVREMLFFFLFPFVAVALFQTLSGNYFPFYAFAKSSAEQIVPEENHRLENFLISTKERDDWTRLMLAILNSVSAVENVLSEGVSVNIRGTEEFHGVTPLMFASGIGAQTIVKLLIDQGADVNTKAKLKNFLTSKTHISTPLDSTIVSHNNIAHDLLRKHGAKTGEELKAEGK